MRVKAKFRVKTPYDVAKDSSHTVLLTVIFTLTLTSGAALKKARDGGFTGEFGIEEGEEQRVARGAQESDRLHGLHIAMEAVRGQEFQLLGFIRLAILYTAELTKTALVCYRRVEHSAQGSSGRRTEVLAPRRTR